MKTKNKSASSSFLTNEKQKEKKLSSKKLPDVYVEAKKSIRFDETLKKENTSKTTADIKLLSEKMSPTLSKTNVTLGKAAFISVNFFCFIYM